MGIEKTELDRALSTARELQLEASSPQRTLYFHGESMRPFLVEGDEVVVQPVEWSHIRPGDVITYRYLDRFPTRRVVRKTDDELHLWCENWPARRFLAARGDVLGRAVSRRRGDSWLTCSSSAWKLARLSAMLRWRFEHARDVVRDIPERARRAPKKLLRMIGLLPPIGER